MAEKTKIEWTDSTWSPVTGCLNGCIYCYARGMTKRFKKLWPKGFEPHFRGEWLNKPLHWCKSRKIFVCDMADLFGEWVPQDWIDQVFGVVRQCPQHTFQFLTKCPDRLPSISWTSNSWVGTTCNNQAMHDKAREPLSRVNAPVRFMSAEPLHGPIDLGNKPPIDWLIIGAQTGRKKMQPEKAWVDSLIEQARAFKIPVFIKDNLDYPSLHEWPECNQQRAGA